jgi:hypothetical protein
MQHRLSICTLIITLPLSKASWCRLKESVAKGRRSVGATGGATVRAGTQTCLLLSILCIFFVVAGTKFPFNKLGAFNRLLNFCTEYGVTYVPGALTAQ